MHLYSKYVVLFLFSFLTEWAHFRSVYRLRESSLSLMIYRVSGLDEPPLDVSPTPALLVIRQCRLQYTEPYVGSWVSYIEAETLPCDSGRTFSSLYIRRIPLFHHIQWEWGIVTQGEFVPVAIYCGWGIKLLASRNMDHITTWKDQATVMFFSVWLLSP